MGSLSARPTLRTEGHPMIEPIISVITSILILANAHAPVPEQYVQSGAVRGDECGQYTSLCWNSLVRAGLGPLQLDPVSRLTNLKTMGLTLRCESGLDPDRVHVNRTGSIDRGIAQWNSYWHPQVTDEQAFNPATAIDLMAEQWAAGNRWIWVCYQRLFLK